MSKWMLPTGIGGAADILSAADFGATNFVAGLANTTLQSLFQKRGETARRIALKEMAECKRSKFDVQDADEFVAIAYRYGRAALEGAARLNLLLMAKVMKGQALAGEIYASEFNEFADLISSLKSREIVYLGTMIKLYKQGVQIKKEDSEERYELEQSVSIDMKRELIGTAHFQDARAFSACESSLQRTSLIYPKETLIGGGAIYAPTGDLERLRDLVDFMELVDGGEIRKDLDF